MIGSGAIGIEFSQIYARFGSRVTAIEAPRGSCRPRTTTAAAALVPALEDEGIRLLAGVTIERADHAAGAGRSRSRASSRSRSTSSSSRRDAGRCSTGTTCAAAGIELDEAGRPVLSDTLRTTAPNVWAAGDATGELLFTHVGSYEAELVVDDILGTRGRATTGSSRASRSATPRSRASASPNPRRGRPRIDVLTASCASRTTSDPTSTGGPMAS